MGIGTKRNVTSNLYGSTQFDLDFGVVSNVMAYPALVENDVDDANTLSFALGIRLLDATDGATSLITPTIIYSNPLPVTANATAVTILEIAPNSTVSSHHE